MNQQPTTTDKQRVLKGDFLFACSMFIVGCIFLTGLIAAPFWDFAQTQKIISANSTSTAFVVATQQAHVTATAAAHAMEQTKYEFIDYFDDNTNHWMEGSSNDEYAADETKVAGGVYAWDIYQVRKPFISWENFLEAKKVEDFDVYVDSRIKATKGTISDVCSGFIFRTASADWEQGAYVFSACNNSYFNVKYYKHGEWDAISGKTYSNAIQIDDLPGWLRK